jgi:hypothetical protein
MRQVAAQAVCIAHYRVIRLGRHAYCDHSRDDSEDRHDDDKLDERESTSAICKSWTAAHKVLQDAGEIPSVKAINAIRAL